MRRIITERFCAYAAGGELTSTVRMTIRMRDAVELDMMREALAVTQVRYPYFSVRLKMVNGTDGYEYFALEDNKLPWMMQTTCKPACLMGPESNHHLLAFACWDDCFAIDFFHGLTDGTGAYHLLRTLTYEYCRRRYDNSLSREGIRVAGDVIGPEEWTDPGVQSRPKELNPVQVPPQPRPISLRTEAAAPHSGKFEAVFISVDERQVMEHVAELGTTPATLFSLLLARAVARLHPSSSDAAPAVSLAVNQRPALGAPYACQTLMSGITLTLNGELQRMAVGRQLAEFRNMIVSQLNVDNVIAEFYAMKERMDQLDLMPTIAARRKSMSAFADMADLMGSCGLSYVGKANFGAAEQYVCEMYTEVDSPFELLVEMAAIGGGFCITVMQRFETDVYLDAFVDEMRHVGLMPALSWRRPMQVAPITEFYK